MLIEYRLVLMSLALLFALAGCDLIGQSSQNRYQIVAAPDGHIFRLDTKEGDVFLVEKDVLTRVPEDSKLALNIGRVYRFEDGRWMKYLGGGQFEPSQKRIDWKDLSVK